MPVILIERTDSRSIQVQRYAMTAVELHFLAAGSEDEEEVRQAVEATLPPTWRREGWPDTWQLLLDGYRIDHLGGGKYEVRAQYTSRTDPEWTWETTGGTARITQSKQTVWHWPPRELIDPETEEVEPQANGAPDFKGAIGVDEDTVQGCEITVPVFRFTATVRVPPEVVTPEYMRNVYLLTGRTNDAAFLWFPSGEVLFLGLTGTQRGAEKAALTFHFTASPNVAEFTAGDLGPVPKDGHDYVWFRYRQTVHKDTVEEDKPLALVKRPVAMYVERVYDPGDFSLLGLG